MLAHNSADSNQVSITQLDCQPMNETTVNNVAQLKLEELDHITQ
jgi:hypothetical protein